jgi:hypothetical protein
VKVALARDAEAAERLAVLPEGTDLLALGPLTNIARACRLDPRLPDRISLRAVGGNLSSRGFLPPLWPYEFNMARDPSAAREVFRGAWKGLLLFPLDVVRRVRADEQRLESLAQLSSLGAYLGLTRPPRSLVKPPHRGRYFGNREEVASVSWCDPTEHWEAFETLLASSETPSERLDSATKGS